MRCLDPSPYVPRIAWSAIGVVLLVFTCVGAQAGPLDGVQRVCLHRPELPIADAKKDPRTHDLEAALVAALEAAGFETVGSEAVGGVVERVDAKVGGTIDPYTGRRDPARHEARRLALSEALQQELGCDARLASSVVPVIALFANGTASWDGSSESVVSPGRVVLSAIAGASESGWVQAFSLWLRVLDLQGEEIAFRSAGIETLVRFAVVKDRDLLPQDQWFSDPEKMQTAIQLALGPGGSDLREKGNPAWKLASD